MLLDIVLVIYANVFIFSSPQLDLTEEHNSDNMAKVKEEEIVSLESNKFENSRWFWFVNLMNPYLDLEEKERPVKELFDPIMSFIAPEQKPVKTVNDYQDDFFDLGALCRSWLSNKSQVGSNCSRRWRRRNTSDQTNPPFYILNAITYRFCDTVR